MEQKAAHTAAPFTHTPRPALVTDSHPTQRYFGADRYTATCGIPNNCGRCDATATVGVERIGRLNPFEFRAVLRAAYADIGRVGVVLIPLNSGLS